jgi:hypothetical protein
MLTGEVRVRTTRWRRKLVLQVQEYYTVWTDSDTEEGTLKAVERYSWRDAIIEDLQLLGGLHARYTREKV